MSLRALALIILAGLVVYGLAAYGVAPVAWRHYERQPQLAGRAMVTRTAADIPGDPINIGLVGDQADIAGAMGAVGWTKAEPVTLRSSLDIVGSVVLDRRDPAAPVSPLFYDGRREDLAFEKAVGGSARQRNHVRLWKVLNVGTEGRSVWLGSATFDRGVALSADTGQVTHAIAPDIDAERDGLAGAIVDARRAVTTYEISGIGPTLSGRNGEGDRYYTDGEVEMVVLTKAGAWSAAPAKRAIPPLRIRLKNSLWRGLKPLLRRLA